MNNPFNQVNISLQFIPLSTKKDYLPIIDEVIQYIRSTGIKHEVGALETTMEGSYDEIMQIIKHCHEIGYQNGSDEIVSIVKIHTSQSGDVRMDGKVEKYRL